MMSENPISVYFSNWFWQNHVLLIHRLRATQLFLFEEAIIEWADNTCSRAAGINHCREQWYTHHCHCQAP